MVCIGGRPIDAMLIFQMSRFPITKQQQQQIDVLLYTRDEVANGGHIHNLGEKRYEMMTVGSKISKRIVFQVADVHKPPLSISGCAEMGFDCC